MKYLTAFFILGLSIVCLAIFIKLNGGVRIHNSGKIENRKEPKMSEDNLGNNKRVTVTTLFDNYRYDSRLETGHGFSCLVEIDSAKEKQSILFDTGADGDILLSNMAILGIDIGSLDSIFLSHIHSDHIGGLEKILGKNHDLKVFIPLSFPSSLKQTITSSKADYKEIDNQEKIYDSVYSTGEMGTFIIEQSLILETEKGMIIITGCAHPGIVNIVKKAKEILPGKSVYLVMGGFHLSDKNDKQLSKVIEEFRKVGVEKVAPCHCSGDLTRELFEKEYGKDYIENGIGKVIKI